MRRIHSSIPVQSEAQHLNRWIQWFAPLAATKEQQRKYHLPVLHRGFLPHFCCITNGAQVKLSNVFSFHLHLSSQVQKQLRQSNDTIPAPAPITFLSS